MKATSALIAAVAANGVPIAPRFPGWKLGNPQGQIDINMWYDLFCPDSMAAHYQWKQLFEMDSPVEGKKYKDLINMRVQLYPLPFHIHSFSAGQISVYLDDLCVADSTKCNLHEKYVEYTFANWEEQDALIQQGQLDWINAWTAAVATELGLPQADLLKLY